MLTIDVENAADMRDLFDAAAADPAGRVCIVDVYAELEPDDRDGDGVELQVVAYDPALPTADVPVDVIDRLPRPAPVPSIDERDWLDAALETGRTLARLAYGAGLVSAQSTRAITEDVYRGLQAHPWIHEESRDAALHVGVDAYQREHERLRALSALSARAVMS